MGASDANKIIEQCEWLSELGVTETVVPIPPIAGFDAFKERLEWTAEEILPKIAHL